MRVLALDTATQACSAAVLNGAAACSRFELLERGHAERILRMIDEVLEEAAVTLEALDGIGVGRGPGGFTGVRLAVSIAQGLAFGSGLLLAPVSDLRALAQRALDRDPRLKGVLVCNDARMNEVYWTYTSRDPRGYAEPDTPERVGGIEQVELAVGASGPIAGVGSGFRVYPRLAERFAGRLDYVDPSALPHAEDIARLAALELREGRAVQPERALPVYVRDDVARPPAMPSRD